MSKSATLYLVTQEQLREIHFQNELGWVKQRSDLHHTVTDLEYRLRQARDSICDAHRLIKHPKDLSRNELSKLLLDAYEVLVCYESNWI